MRLVVSYFDPKSIGLVLVLLAVLLLFLGSEGGGDFAVNGGEGGFELLQLVLFAPLLCNDGFELGNVCF